MRWWLSLGCSLGLGCGSGAGGETSAGDGGSSETTASPDDASTSTPAPETGTPDDSGGGSSDTAGEESSSGGEPTCYHIEDPGHCPDEPPVMFECGGQMQCPALDLRADELDTTCVITGLRDRTPGLYRISGLAEGWPSTQIFEVLADGTAILRTSYAIDFACGSSEQRIELADAAVFDACLGVTDYLALLDCVMDFDAGCHLGEPVCPAGA